MSEVGTYPAMTDEERELALRLLPGGFHDMTSVFLMVKRIRSIRAAEQAEGKKS